MTTPLHPPPQELLIDSGPRQTSTPTLPAPFSVASRNTAPFSPTPSAAVTLSGSEARPSSSTYLICQEEDWEDADQMFQEDYNLGQMCLSTALMELGDAWEINLFTKERRWHTNTTQKDAVDNLHTPDPEIPDHCYRDWIDLQAPL